MKNSYLKGKRWGYAVFRESFKDYGELGIAKMDKASRTCSKYLKDSKRNGKALTKEDKNFYKGAIDGMQEFYNKL